ncbi:MAG TPA: putative ABC exporter domain-containing protein [Longimicrobium sp.]|nr:putative ABC exporter domain-containing protein [Longimicrobium sp.]
MNGGLLLLALRLARGRVRLITRRMRTVKGALGIGGAALFLAAVAGVQVWSVVTPGVRTPPPTPDTLRATVPAILVLLTLLSAFSERGLYFTPPETGFLFPAPVGRRELLVYNLVTRLGVQLLSALWVAIFTLRYAPRVVPGLFGIILGFVFIYVAAQALALGAAALEEHFSPLVRHVVRVAAIGALLAVAASAAANAPAGAPGGRFRAMLHAPAVRAVSVVARPIAELFAATSAADALLWGAASLGLIALAAALVLGFDVAYTERSLAVGARVQARLRRFRSGSAPDADAAPAPSRRLRLAAPRRLLPGRAGALAWRQLTELARTPRAIVAPLLMGGAWVLAMFGGSQAADGDPTTLQATVLSSGLILPVFFGNPLPFDFRRDLDRVAFLRSLPLSPWSVAAGQVFPSALTFAAFEMLVLLAVAALTRVVPAEWLGIAALLVFPIAWGAAAVENLMFLLMPYRVGNDGRAGAQFMGKALLLMVVKLVTLAVLGAAGGAAWFGVWLLAESPWPAFVAAALAMAVLCLPLTWLVGRAFVRFDFTHDASAA